MLETAITVANSQLSIAAIATRRDDGLLRPRRRRRLSRRRRWACDAGRPADFGE
jgi:hypothetical protein